MYQTQFQVALLGACVIAVILFFSIQACDQKRLTSEQQIRVLDMCVEALGGDKCIRLNMQKNPEFNYAKRMKECDVGYSNCCTRMEAEWNSFEVPERAECLEKLGSRVCSLLEM